MAGEWDKFLAELTTPNERRQGPAVVEGASRDDLRLEFYSTDSAGHMAGGTGPPWMAQARHAAAPLHGFNDPLSYMTKVLLRGLDRDPQCFADSINFVTNRLNVYNQIRA